MNYFYGSSDKKEKDEDTMFTPEHGDISMQQRQRDDEEEETGGINNLLNDLEAEEQSLIKKSKDKFDQKVDEKIT